MDEKIFIEFVKSLEENRELFYKGLLSAEKEEIFIENIFKLKNYIEIIENQEIKEKVAKFVDEIFKHKNFNIYFTTKRKKDEKIEKSRKIIKEISHFIENNELEQAEKIYQENFTFIKKYNYSFYRNFENNYSIFETLKRRKIQKLCHFTNIKNIESILSKGIIPKKILDERKIPYFYTDLNRYDEKPDCSSFSIEYPNYKMLYLKRIQNDENIYAVIILDVKKILLNDLKKYYVYKNAATSSAGFYLKNFNASNSIYFDNMFLKKIDCHNRPDNLPCYLPTVSQAEILIEGIVEPNNIIEIHFFDNKSYEKFRNICNDISLFQNNNFIVSDFYFKKREDINWEER